MSYRAFPPVLIVLLAASGSSAQAITFDDSMLRVPTVKGAPYSATKSVQLTQGVVRSYAVYRDSEGRTATTPAFLPNGEYFPRFTEIDDPVAGYWYVVDSSQRLVHMFKMPPKVSARKTTATAEQPTSLGNLILLGVATKGARIFLPGGRSVERWFSDDLQIPMVVRTISESGTTVSQITSITVGDPASSVFQIPADYTVVRESAPLQIK